MIHQDAVSKHIHNATNVRCHVNLLTASTCITSALPLPTRRRCWSETYMTRSVKINWNGISTHDDIVQAHYLKPQHPFITYINIITCLYLNLLGLLTMCAGGSQQLMAAAITTATERTLPLPELPTTSSIWRLTSNAYPTKEEPNMCR